MQSLQVEYCEGTAECSNLKELESATPPVFLNPAQTALPSSVTERHSSSRRLPDPEHENIFESDDLTKTPTTVIAHLGQFSLVSNQ
jgi:hypothetical protein